MAALNMAKAATATNPIPAGFAAAYLLAQNEYNTALDNDESATYAKGMQEAQTKSNSYLFRLVNRIKTGLYDADKCEKGTTAAPNCTKTESSFAAGTSVWAWNTGNKCNTTASEVCEMRGLETQTDRAASNTTGYGAGLINLLDEAIGVKTSPYDTNDAGLAKAAFDK